MVSLNHIHSRSDIEDGKMEKTNLTYENRLIIVVNLYQMRLVG